jgi:hypothetical protein
MYNATKTMKILNIPKFLGTVACNGHTLPALADE